MPLKYKKHKKSYIHYPIGKAGRDFKFQNIVKLSQKFGGDGRDHGGALPQDRASFHFTNPLAQYNTAQNPWVISPALLTEMFFDTLPSSLAVAPLFEAKEPDMFLYRYLFPVFYSVSFVVRRCRLVFDTDESHTSFQPSPTDLLTSEQAMDFPCTYYWRADCSNLANLAIGGTIGQGMYSGDNTDWQNKDYYTSGAEDSQVKLNLFDSLRNRRWSKCTVYPKQNCKTQMNCHFNHMAPTGKLPDTQNTGVWSSASNADLNVGQFVRKFMNTVGISGQTEMYGLPSFPGDLYILMQMPEIAPEYQALVNKPNDSSMGARARLFVDYEVNTKLVLRGLEQYIDTIKFGLDWPSF